MDLKEELIVFSKALYSYQEETIYLDKKANRVINLVSVVLDVPIPLILGKARNMEYILPRHAFMYIMNKVNGYSLKEVGRLTDRDHSTVIHAIRSIECRLLYPKSFEAKKINELLELLS